MNKRILVALASASVVLVCVGSSTSGAQTRPPTTDVPITKVVLYSSGVGYFEHAGTVHGTSSTELRFKTNQINDILKSIMLQDQDGGHVGAITYPSQDPLSKTLKSFQVDIAQNPSLADLLNQLRGARVTIQVQAERIGGTILGVEMRSRAVEKGEPMPTPVLNVLTGATIRSVDLESVTSLSLDDPQLEAELSKALAALVQARDQDKKPVTISFVGNGDRRVRIGYVVETPVWKTSYRLMLDEKSNVAKLQGWAIVENQTENDWNDVSLSLVSGRPISFIMDLYQPLYATRPTVVPQLFAGLRPQIYGAGLDGKTDSAQMTVLPSMLIRGAANPAFTQRVGNSVARSQPAALSEIVVTGASAPADYASSVQSQATTASLGELFQYTVGNVTLPRQKSAMLPIVTDTVDIERVSIYNASVLASNPLNGVRLVNTTGKHLLQGPVTVLEKGGYAGDARIDNLPPGQERLLSYGIDLDVLMSAGTGEMESSSLLTASIHKGLLIVNRKFVSSREYSANNKSSKAKLLIIEHPIRPGWKLIEPQTPSETTPSVYRFKGSATANKITKLTVREELVQSETVGMISADVPSLIQYSKAGEIPNKVRDAIAKAAQLRQAVLDLEHQMAERSQRVNDITQEQNRLRENMKTVAQTTQYYERLLEKLNEQESAIESLQKERESLTVQRDAVRKQLQDYLNDLTIE